MRWATVSILVLVAYPFSWQPTDAQPPKTDNVIPADRDKPTPYNGSSCAVRRLA